MARTLNFLNVALTAIVLSSSTETLSASTNNLTFASFSQQQPNQHAFLLTNNGLTGANKSLSLTSIKTETVLYIDPNTPTTAAGAGYAGQSIDAYLWLTSSTTTAAFSFAGLLDQPFTGNTTIRIQSRADSDAGNMNYLLIAAYQQGDMLGQANHHSTAEFSSTVVSYSSHYLNLSGTENGELQLNFSAVAPTYKLGANSLVASFSAAGGGNFSADFVPEPQTYALFATVLAVLGWKIRRSRRTSR